MPIYLIRDKFPAFLEVTVNDETFPDDGFKL